MIGYKTRKCCLIISANENFSFCDSRMDKVLTDSVTGQQYMLHPGPEELQKGIVEYVPALHAHLWSYVTVHG